MEREKLVEKMHEAAMFSTVPKEKALKPGTVIDEEKSVRWNREQVEKSQENYQNEVKRLRKEQNRLYTELKKDVLKYIEEEMEHPVTERQKELIYSTAYEYGHSSSYEFFNKVDEICEFCDSFMKG